MLDIIRYYLNLITYFLLGCRVHSTDPQRENLTTEPPRRTDFYIRFPGNKVTKSGWEVVALRLERQPQNFTRILHDYSDERIGIKIHKFKGNFMQVTEKHRDIWFFSNLCNGINFTDLTMLNTQISKKAKSYI